MATEVIKIIDPDNADGTDYISLYNYEAGYQKNLVSADEVSVAQCRSSDGSADTTQLTIAGWTTDATRYIRIEPYSGHAHNGTWDTSKYRFHFTMTTGYDQWGITITQAHVKLTRLQIGFSATGATGSGGNDGAIYINTTTADHVIQIEKCLIVGSNLTGLGNNNPNGIRLYGNTPTVAGYIKIWNNIIYDFNIFSRGYGMDISGMSLSHFVLLYNNTVCDCYYGISGGGSQTIAINNIVQGTGLQFNYMNCSGTGTTHNLSEDNSAPPYGTYYTLKSVTFMGESSNNFKLSGSDTEAKDKGTDLSANSYIAFSDDILGNDRPSGEEWDLGANEYQVDNRFKFRF